MEGSLKRLKTEYLDLLLLHRPDALSPEKELARNIRLGSLDMGHAPLAADPALFPLSQVMGLDLGLKNPLNAQAAFWRIYAELPEIRNEFSGIKILALHARQPYDLYMFQDGIYNADELENKRLLTDSSPAALGLIHLEADALPAPSRQTSGASRPLQADGALLTLDQAMNMPMLAGYAPGAVGYPAPGPAQNTHGKQRTQTLASPGRSPA